MLRRSFLRAVPIAAAAVALPVGAIQPNQSPSERLDAAIEELKAATEAVYPGVNRWAIIRADDPAHSLPLVVAAKVAETPVSFTGPGVYEFALLDQPYGSGFIQPVAFLDHSPRRDGWYRWQHYHRGRFQGRGRHVPAGRLKIIRKVEAPGEQA